MLGTTPLEHVSATGARLYRIELDGLATWWRIGTPEVSAVLRPDGHELARMAEIAESGARNRLLVPGFDHLTPEPIPTFYIDRFEVTNREYREFLEAGGYSSSSYWVDALELAGVEEDWQRVVERFVDVTGRPGPATWIGGDYPDGDDDYPVAGISWFEAMAYASYRGKTLPTLWHWNRAAGVGQSDLTLGSANIDTTSGTIPIGESGSLTRHGVFDMAGNVREWLYNETPTGLRYLVGGGWDDAEFAYQDAQAYDPWDRSPTNGVRLAAYEDDTDPVVLFTMEPIRLSPPRDFALEEPVSDEVFEAYRGMFTYDPLPLNAVVEDADTTSDYIGELVSFDAAYGERMMAYVHRPPDGAGPFQTVVYFPGSGVIRRRESRIGREGYIDFLVKSGRAVVLPVYKGTLERGGDLPSDYPEETAAYRGHLVQWVQDFNRAIDYVETRPDLDAEKIAYFGYSWGGSMGGIVPAVSPRVDAVVLRVAGMYTQRALPEAEMINYLPRVTQPVVMINGEHDYYYPVETNQRPMFDLLGTPAHLKKWDVYPGSHDVPREVLIKETLDWLDAHLGPVRPRRPDRSGLR